MLMFIVIIALEWQVLLAAEAIDGLRYFGQQRQPTQVNANNQQTSFNPTAVNSSQLTSSDVFSSKWISKMTASRKAAFLKQFLW